LHIAGSRFISFAYEQIFMAQGAIQQKADELVAEHGAWIEWAGRIGFATKGVVYGMIGAMAAAAAWQGGRAQGSEGAIREIGQQPFGQILLWMIAAGLAGYALWQFVRAAVDPERRGREWKDLARRACYALCGVIYAGLAIYAAPGSVGGGSSSEASKGLIGSALSYPGGQALVAAVGLGIVGFACFELYLAWTQNFMREYQVHKMNDVEHKTARWAGTVGLAARGVTFLIIGAFVVVAAVKLDPNQAKSFGEALEVLAQQSYGPWILMLVGLGLVAYAVYCGTQAFYRRFAIR
jgi:hypothetical protein